MRSLGDEKNTDTSFARDGLRLVKAFMGVKNPTTRERIINEVEQAAIEEKTKIDARS